TNKHVVADEQAEYTVILGDKTEHPAKVLARDPSNDIAVIKIEGENFPVLTLGDSDTIRVGETIIAIGNPLGEFENSVSRGIISGLKRSFEASSGMGDSERLSGIIQVDAAINPGNSGGPLFSLEGVVVGVNVAMAQGAENIGFALPVNQVKRIVEQVRTTGRLSFPYLGVRSITLNDALQKKTGLPYNYGALVVRGDTITDFAVIPGSPADKAGIVENDILLEINGEKIDETHGLISFMGQYAVGDEVTVKVWHKGEVKDIKVKLEERSQ
nr:trypsin-like peptidase domain-containing protein [Candidatus Moranbacteria bacterium]